MDSDSADPKPENLMTNTVDSSEFLMVFAFLNSYLHPTILITISNNEMLYLNVLHSAKGTVACASNSVSINYPILPFVADKYHS